MVKKTAEELNHAAMQMILYAGNSRNLVNEALRDMENGAQKQEVLEKMKKAKDESTQAHRIQTDMIQSTIEDDELQTTLLFTHAQDTLMTIYSELNISNHLIRLYYKLEEKI